MRRKCILNAIDLFEFYYYYYFFSSFLFAGSISVLIWCVLLCIIKQNLTLNLSRQISLRIYYLCHVRWNFVFLKVFGNKFFLKFYFEKLLCSYWRKSDFICWRYVWLWVNTLWIGVMMYGCCITINSFMMRIGERHFMDLCY